MKINKIFNSQKELKYYWAFVVFVIFYLNSVHINTEEYVIPVIASLISAGFALHVSGYLWSSPITILILAHVIQYPVATILIMTISHPSLAMEMDLWEITSPGLWAMTIGMLGLTLGFMLVKPRKKLFIFKDKYLSSIEITSFEFNLLLTMLIIPIVFIYLYSGIYYHKDVAGIESYSFENANLLGVVGYLIYIVYLGIILQVNRYLVIKSSQELTRTVIIILIPTLLMLPTGTRSSSFIFLILPFIFFLEYGKSKVQKGIIIMASIFIFSFLTVIIGSYRLTSNERNESSFYDRITKVITDITLLKLSTDNIEIVDDFTKISLSRRLSDVQSVSFLIDNIPSKYPHRGFEDIDKFPIFIIPTLIRPEIGLELNYDATLMMKKYQFRTEIGGSSPMMLLGEMYERFGWSGIFIGMIIVGLIMGKMQKYYVGRKFEQMALWSFSFYTITMFHAISLLKIFIFFTKQLVIFYILIVILKYIMSLMKKDEEKLNSNSFILILKMKIIAFIKS
ncbi:MAG: O-antigen polymerase [Bacteroidota bacterium]